ncbi:hypothetical protein HanRHA438_Chr02g0064781 [Helianthus annuus]|nr:hypothetical protein HanRHA438_Chr02g0064781 [Helianthus annuus]
MPLSELSKQIQLTKTNIPSHDVKSGLQKCCKSGSITVFSSKVVNTCNKSKVAMLMAAEEVESERKAIGATAPSPPQEHKRNATRKQPVGQEEGNEYLNHGMMQKECEVL